MFHPAKLSIGWRSTRGSWLSHPNTLSEKPGPPGETARSLEAHTADGVPPPEHPSLDEHE